MMDSRKIPHPLFPKTPKEWDSSIPSNFLFDAIKSMKLNHLLSEK
jgi:hypothetical protein